MELGCFVSSLSGSVLRGDVTYYNIGEGDVRGDLSGGGDIVEVSGIFVCGFVVWGIWGSHAKQRTLVQQG
ncbi:hypothetical protein CEXT_387551 [Caerostris extrusa]|uniref:Uncharacterized protein n=1 Tax=Caerostris extrusa TaxID=172846 RepID=A0AAV4TR67_CAEEX|nr:hypothetical protein CEXT_387551 [Caerostris extrusa]